MSGRIRYIALDDKEDWLGGVEINVLNADCPEKVLVRDRAGRERAFPHWTVDVGHLCFIDGTWHDMESERARRYRTERDQDASATHPLAGTQAAGWSVAASVTPGAVRCSAWFGVAVIAS